MSYLPKTIKGLLHLRAHHHEVNLRPRAESPGVVRLEVSRDSRRAAKGDQAIHLSATQARELMRALQGAADEADRLAYVAEKERARLEQLGGLEPVVAELAAKGIR